MRTPTSASSPEGRGELDIPINEVASEAFPKGEGREGALSLYELNQMVADAISMGMPDEYWVEAELSECRESRGIAIWN